MRIFITGGTGFVGRPTVVLLKKRGHHLLILSRTARHKPGLKFLKGDLAHIERWERSLKAFKPDAAIHLAWEGVPSGDFEVNLKNMANGAKLFRVLGEAKCKTIVVGGSGHEYGEAGKRVSEQTPLHPYNMLYGAKAGLYEFGSAIAEHYKMDLVWARLFFIYGPGQRSKALIPYLVSCIKEGALPEIRNPNGANDFIYIEDVARALVRLVERKPKHANEIYNVGSGKLTPVSVVVKMVYALLDLEPPAVRAKGKPQGFWADIRKIKKDFDWKPKIALREGIRKTLERIAPIS